MKELRIKLGSLKFRIERLLTGGGRYYDPKETLFLFENYVIYFKRLKQIYPALFNDFPIVGVPIPSNTTDHEGRGYIERGKLESLLTNVQSSISIIEEAGTSLNMLQQLTEKLSFIIEEVGNGLSIPGDIITEYGDLVRNLEEILQEDLSKYTITINYQDENGSWGDGELFRIRSKSLKAYLEKLLQPNFESKAQGASDMTSIRSAIKTNLRRAFGDNVPTDEKGVKNEVEKILNVLKVDLKREQDQIAYSTSGRIPDFTVNDLVLAIEVKLCDSKERAKEIIEEINSDITAYKVRYNNMLFVIYDSGGFISDEPRYVSDFEKNKGVMVDIVKQ